MNRNDKRRTVKKEDKRKGRIDPNKTKTFVVHHETTLIDYLCEKLPGQSRRNVQRIIANHQVAVGGAPVSLFTYHLYPEDEVILSWTRIQKRERKDLPIIYEDEHMIVINKPSGLLSIASDREKGRNAYRLVTDYITQTNRNARIFVVHRLDEDTSGVLMFAKDFETKEVLQKNWQDIVKDRAYYAIVEGEDIQEEGHLKDYLMQSQVTQLMYVTKDRTHGKLCVTNFKKMASRNGMSLLDVHIDSGRKNQIRVQLGNIGHHVIGDDKYGEPINPIKRLGLHAYELIFTHPVTGKLYDFKAPIPPEFKKLFWKTHIEERQEKEEALAKKTGKTAKKSSAAPKPAKKQKGEYKWKIQEKRPSRKR